jgi:5-formyltetrahydrofolate cyclo-ligase
VELVAAAEGAIQAQARRHLPGLLAADQRLGLYWPLPGEIDLRGLQALLPERLALPAITGDPAARLVYRPWRSGEALEPDACGIPAPPASSGELAAQELGLLLVPALSCDAAGVRLGYGGGWYDRLRAEPPWGRVPALAVLPESCRVERLPRDPWDVPLHGWFDDNGPCWLKERPDS